MGSDTPQWRGGRQRRAGSGSAGHRPLRTSRADRLREASAGGGGEPWGSRRDRHATGCPTQGCRRGPGADRSRPASLSNSGGRGRPLSRGGRGPPPAGTAFLTARPKRALSTGCGGQDEAEPPRVRGGPDAPTPPPGDPGARTAAPAPTCQGTTSWGPPPWSEAEATPTGPVGPPGHPLHPQCGPLTALTLGPSPAGGAEAVARAPGEHSAGHGTPGVPHAPPVPPYPEPWAPVLEEERAWGRVPAQTGPREQRGSQRTSGRPPGPAPFPPARPRLTLLAGQASPALGARAAA